MMRRIADSSHDNDEVETMHGNAHAGVGDQLGSEGFIGCLQPICG
jgi:hypothetical protein